ncbi:choice-of-anchor L domain-containing protein [Flavobacterium sp.]|uniref:choice-of-anchor L domain-containing protein n=1 Tax=Flavobacterium sp. TaxID=239 RepID=UPI004034677C
MKKKLLFSLVLFPLLALAQPANDECGNAIQVPLSWWGYDEVTVSSDLQGATASGEPSGCIGIADDDIWFKFTAENPRHRMTFYGSGNTNTMVYVVYEGSCTGNVISCGTWGVFSWRLLEGLTPAQDYYVRFYSVGPASVGNTVNVSIAADAGPMDILTQYSAQELVNDMISGSIPPHIIISNVSSSTGSDFGDVNGLAGYWDASMDDFPVGYGIVLTTGNAGNISGPNSQALSEGTNSWPGDPDLQQILGPSDPGGFLNASSLQFDFVANHPLLNVLGISYVFASEDYGAGQCGPADAFAIILTNLDSGEKVNLGVVPGTDIPLSATTARDNAFNSDCPSENSTYFGEYFTAGDTFAMTNFNGRTKGMDVSVPIETGIPYRIKFIVADRDTAANDSALFIGGGWFNVAEPLLGPTASSPQGFIEGETLTDIEIEGENIQWYASADGGEPIPENTLLEDGITYYASQTVGSIESQERTPIQVFLMLGTAENAISKLYAHPNPVKEVLYLSGNEIAGSATISDILGNTVIRQEISGTSASIDVSGLMGGIYFVKLISGDAQKTIKIIKL